jgi:hypothetical protein
MANRPVGSPEPPGFSCLGLRRCNGRRQLGTLSAFVHCPCLITASCRERKEGRAMGPRRARWLFGMLVAWLAVLSGGMLLALL